MDGSLQHSTLIIFPIDRASNLHKMISEALALFQGTDFFIQRPESAVDHLELIHQKWIDAELEPIENRRKS